MKISAVSFLWNEESCIARCLDSIKDYVDEIVIFDLESTDNTFNICKKYTDKVYRVPYLLCGDEYKQELVYRSTGDWLLWIYGDESFPEYTAKSFKKFTELNRWNAFSFMRHEYMDDVRLKFKKDNQLISYGTPECTNYQIRLIKKDSEIFYTGLVHAEIHGKYQLCTLPSEYYMEHRKTSNDQEFDNIRLYIIYSQLIWKYGNTCIEPYKRYVDSYKKIVHDSEAKNLSGERKIHLGEEFWWDWRKFANEKRITCEEFKEKTGIEYKEFIKKSNVSDKIAIVNSIQDKAVLITERDKEE